MPQLSVNEQAPLFRLGATATASMFGSSAADGPEQQRSKHQRQQQQKLLQIHEVEQGAPPMHQ
jgi:hypothetical protein